MPLPAPTPDSTCLVTGATSDIGKETAVALARAGATVVIVGRDRQRSDAALAEIRAKSGNPSVSLVMADLSSHDPEFAIVEGRLEESVALINVHRTM